MAKKSKDISINLVPKDPFFETPIGKALKWALSVGRYIVIFTELVVILSFVTRFNLDRQVTDLNGEINRQSNIIRSYGPLEEEIRTVQAKIDQYLQIEETGNIAEIFPKLSEITPRDVRLDQLSVRSDSISLTGTTLSQGSLSLLINNIQLSPHFWEVRVNQIETGDSSDPGFHFSISAAIGREVAAEPASRAPAERVNILDRTQGL